MKKFPLISIQLLILETLTIFHAVLRKKITQLYLDERVGAALCGNVAVTCETNANLSALILTMINDKCRCVRNQSECHTLLKFDLGGNTPQ